MIRSRHGRARPSSPWQMLAMISLVVLVPTACVVWFLLRALEGERLALEHRELQLLRRQANDRTGKLALSWRATLGACERIATEHPPGAAFARVVGRDDVVTALILGDSGELLYPDERLDLTPATGEDSEWSDATSLEFARGNPAAAAERWRQIAAGRADPTQRALALQGHARCLAKAGNHQAAIGTLLELAERPELAVARDPLGGLIAASALLRALELLEGTADVRYAQAREGLVRRLESYEPPLLPASQRLMLMRTLAQLEPEKPAPQSFAAESVAEHLREHLDVLRRPGLHAIGTDLLALTGSPPRVVVALDRASVTAAGLAAADGDLEWRLLAPGEASRTALVTDDLPAPFDGWRIAALGRAPDGVAWVGYATAGFLTIAAILLFGFLAVRLLDRQLHVARLKTDLASTVSHEVRTPLAAMRALTETLLEGRCRDDGQRRRYLELLDQENQRLSTLVEGFLSLRRLERDQVLQALQPTDLLDVVAAGLRTVEDRFRAAGRSIDVDASGTIPRIDADATALTTALINLLDNAYKYGGPGDVRISIDSDPKAVTIAVEDRGIGMTRREARRAFDRYWQADRALSRTRGGCGIGLAIVRAVAEAHGGKAHVRSEVDAGSRFMITLPITRNGVSRDAPEES